LIAPAKKSVREPEFIKLAGKILLNWGSIPPFLTLWSWIVDLVVKFFDLLGQKIRSKFLTFYKRALTEPVYVNLKINVNHEIRRKSSGATYFNGVRFFHYIYYWCCVMVRKIPNRRGPRMGRTNINYIIRGVDPQELMGPKAPMRPKFKQFWVNKSLSGSEIPLSKLQKELREIAVRNLLTSSLKELEKKTIESLMRVT